MVVHKTKTAVSILFICCCIFISCGKGKKSLPTIAIEETERPFIRYENISMLISDSGITRYRLITNIWEMYETGPDPYWYFPDKLYVEKFDSLFVEEASIQADTAYYYSKRELWRLIGNVFIKNQGGDTFETSELFWDQKEDANSINSIYTDKFVLINKGGDIIKSYGLRSNQAMTNFRIYHSNVEMFFRENTVTKDSVSSGNENLSEEIENEESNIEPVSE